MTDRSTDPVSERIHSEAAAWIVRSQSGGQDQEALSHWLAADPRHRAAYQTIADTWGASLGLAESAMGRDRKLVRAPLYMRRSTHLAAAAASVGIVICASTAWLTNQGPFAALVSPAGAQTFATAVGELKTITLADGSSITLDTDSRVTVTAGSPFRLELEQGRMRVRPVGSNRSINIASKGAAANLKGGTFDFLVTDGAPIIVAIEAPLALQTVVDGHRKIERTLALGDKADLRSGTTLPKAPEIGVQWVEGMIGLNRAPLGAAISAINRYNRVKIRLTDPKLSSRPVTGAFRARNPLAFAHTLAVMFDLKLTRPSPDEIMLVPKH